MIDIPVMIAVSTAMDNTPYMPHPRRCIYLTTYWVDEPGPIESINWRSNGIGDDYIGRRQGFTFVLFIRRAHKGEMQDLLVDDYY